MLPRFLADQIDPDAATARLSEEETRHLSQVLRLSIGDEIAVFDGTGREFRARVERIARDGADVRLIEEVGASPEPAVRLTLAQSVIKGEKMDDVVRDATMMGASAIEPLVTEHTAAHMKAGRAPERWRRIAIASAKQCRRAVVPSIGVGTQRAPAERDRDIAGADGGVDLGHAPPSLWPDEQRGGGRAIPAERRNWVSFDRG